LPAAGLANASWIFAAIYSFVAFVAIGTSGPDLVKEPLAYYSTLAPLAFAWFCWWTGTHHVPRRQLLQSGIVAHVLAMPSIPWSLLGLGVGLLVLSYLWWRAYARIRSQDSAPP
jgi:hypothetical protein